MSESEVRDRIALRKRYYDIFLPICWQNEFKERSHSGFNQSLP
jgi:hypothetical protein